jgi:sigma-B regulation protein RsbU (phosphoserine phosphatase)
MRAEGQLPHVTLACVRCRRTGEVEYSLAGHGPILHYHSRSKTVTALSLQQFPLGWFGDAVYGAETTRMEPGDRLLLSADGVTEVFDENDTEFGFKRLERLLVASANIALASVLPAILVDVRAYP